MTLSGTGKILEGLRGKRPLADSDARFWIDWLVKDGKTKEGQFNPSDIYTNEFNPYVGKR